MSFLDEAITFTKSVYSKNSRISRRDNAWVFRRLDIQRCPHDYSGLTYYGLITNPHHLSGYTHYRNTLQYDTCHIARLLKTIQNA